MRRQRGLASVTTLVLAAGFGTSCYRAFGVGRTVEISQALDTACVAAALSDKGVRDAKHQVTRPDYIAPAVARREGWYHEEFAYPGAAGVGHVGVLVAHNGSRGTELRVYWERPGDPLSRDQCDRMDAYVDDLYQAIRRRCPVLPRFAPKDERVCTHDGPG